MCNAKPLPRCAFHAADAYQRSLASYSTNYQVAGEPSPFDRAQLDNQIKTHEPGPDRVALLHQREALDKVLAAQLDYDATDEGRRRLNQQLAELHPNDPAAHILYARQEAALHIARARTEQAALMPAPPAKAAEHASLAERESAKTAAEAYADLANAREEIARISAYAAAETKRAGVASPTTLQRLDEAYDDALNAEAEMRMAYAPTAEVVAMGDVWEEIPAADPDHFASAEERRNYERQLQDVVDDSLTGYGAAAEEQAGQYAASAAEAARQISLNTHRRAVAASYAHPTLLPAQQGHAPWVGRSRVMTAADGGTVNVVAVRHGIRDITPIGEYDSLRLNGTPEQAQGAAMHLWRLGYSTQGNPASGTFIVCNAPDLASFTPNGGRRPSRTKAA